MGTEHKNQPFGRRLRCALQGLAFALRTEHSLRFQALTFALLLLVLIVLRPAPVWWALALLSATGVVAAELFNTALEQLADHLHPEMHARIRLVKDCAAAAVLVAVAGALAVGIALLVHLSHERLLIE